jgi:acylaminoacyl-peptidase
MLTTVRKMGYEGRSVVMGGSYGGYMGGILGSRYGEHFNAAILLNPVLNIPFMLGISDIPEWCISTCLNEFEKWNLAPGEYKKMFDMSPMS